MDVMTEKHDSASAPVNGKDVIEELAASGALDSLFARIDAGDIEMTGDGGLIPGLIKAALERGLAAELTDHLGYEKGSVEAPLTGRPYTDNLTRSGTGSPTGRRP